MNHVILETQMAKEILSIPDVLNRQIEEGLDLYLETGRQAAASKPRGFITCARGTSDNAATFFKYIMETHTGLPVASMGPSVASVYNAHLKLNDFICLTISQSGGSTDLASLQAAASKGGARTIAILNETDSPVGRQADIVLPMLAGTEKAVAATKSFVSSLFAILGFVAGFTNDSELEKSLRDFPRTAAKTLECDWSMADLSLARASSVFAIGRGPGLAVSAEAALKLKETCRIHAEAFSAAEVLHGPVVLAEKKFAVFAFQSEDASQQSVLDAAKSMREKGADVFTISAQSGEGRTLITPRAENNLLTPIVQIIAFYKFVEALSKKLGENADAPEGLNKVTVTI
ncbi:SIS domain-containing protein [Ahrensia sp. 13_GOM-1096m]|uniref:SIS domain-containing protein n=1 Tax=Ahrensia sp. 13_GOM-1096m TaxID=1380380 RepID=UPI0005559C78|nr:SIS domain-containing protein [Ahrensia sp. 13_GOM-1096m]